MVISYEVFNCLDFSYVIVRTTYAWVESMGHACTLVVPRVLESRWTQRERGLWEVEIERAKVQGDSRHNVHSRSLS